MIPCLIKPLDQHLDKKAFTLTELMVAVAFSIILMTGVYGFYSASSKSYSSGITGQTLQDTANEILNKIIEGETESGTVFRLATATSYMIPNGSANSLYTCGGSAQVAPCNSSNTYSELYFCTDSPCGGSADLTARWYYLNSAGTSIIYHHPPRTGSGTVEENIYTAPKGATIILRFAPATVNTSFALEIDVALTQSINPTLANSRLVTGAASTYVLLRNHP